MKHLCIHLCLVDYKVGVTKAVLNIFGSSQRWVCTVWITAVEHPMLTLVTRRPQKCNHFFQAPIMLILKLNSSNIEKAISQLRPLLTSSTKVSHIISVPLYRKH